MTDSEIFVLKIMLDTLALDQGVSVREVAQYALDVGSTADFARYLKVDVTYLEAEICRLYNVK